MVYAKVCKNSMDLQLFIELYRLWEPVYPHLAKDIGEMYRRSDGNVLEMGPFCGAISHWRRTGQEHPFRWALFREEWINSFAGK